MLKQTLALVGVFFFLSALMPPLSVADDEGNTSSEQTDGDVDSSLSNMDIDPTNSLADQAEEQDAPNLEE